MCNINKKKNTWGPTSSIKIIIHVENKSSFCFITINWEWVFMIKLLSGNRKKRPICINIKGSEIKPAWIELIKNNNGKTKKWGGIKIMEKRWIIKEISFY